MKGNNTYREKRKQHDLKLINEGRIFNGDKGKKPYLLNNLENREVPTWRPKADLLMYGNNNLYPQITDEVILYFALNQISFHHLEGDSDFGFCIPSGHTLSSQIACLNHLYPLRYDKDAVLAIARQICPDINDVLEIETDQFLPGYISFEVTSDIDHLNETKGNQKLTRGKMCTSVDALIYGQLKDNQKIILPIEWKYTEYYHEDGKPDKDYSAGRKGKERLRRYSGLITDSQQLCLKSDDYKGSVYFFEPFYQLMRQTLWVEQMIANRAGERLQADHFLHVHVIPWDNHDLLKKTYPCSGVDMETTWRKHLKDNSKYQILSPEELLQGIDREKYCGLLEYLKTRYR
jgi:hypothetical protein